MKTGSRLPAALLVVAFAVVVLRNGWIHDDGYITYRTVDNFINGYGLRWNPAERVQTYTHPLWMFVVAPAYGVTHEVYFTVIAVSVALSAAAALLIAFGVANSPAMACLGVVALTLSKAFVDYSTSGLENPLTHVVYASFLVVYFHSKASRESLFVLATLAALSALNRLDTALLYLPVLAVILIDVGWTRGLADVAAGFIPLLLWEVFSIIYYGFPFPNTAYAKLFGTGVGRGELVAHGWYYLLNSARIDPLTLLTIGAASVAAASSGDRRQLAIAGGVVAYVVYVVLIGGDFVTGRFLSAPLLGSVALLTRRPVSWRVAAAAAAVAAVVGLSASDPPLLTTAASGSEGTELMDTHGIADERPYYYPHAGFLNAIHGDGVSRHPWAIEGAEARRRRMPLAVRGDIGYFGFYAGPQVHIVDLWGLGDPLLARLPARSDVAWRVGHFTRTIPDGYLETLASGTNRIGDRKLAAYYDRLALITRGSLFDRRRLLAIWDVNVGN